MNLSTFNFNFTHKKFINWFFLISALLFLAHLFFFEFFTRIILIPNSYIKINENKILSKKNFIEILALGDSHTQAGLNLSCSNYFNFGQGSDSPVIQYFKLKFAMRYLKRLKILILQADYHQFSYYMTLGSHYKQYKDYIDEEVDRDIGYYPKANEGRIFFYSLEENYSPILYRALFRYITGKNINSQGDTLINGTAPMGGRWQEITTNHRKISTETRLRIQVYNNYLINDKILKYYEELVRIARLNDIHVMLMRYPLSNEYLNNIDRDTEQKMEYLYNYMSNKYDIPILDYRKLFEKKQEYFADMDHLNFEGSKVLGNIVSKDVGYCK